MNCTKHEFVKNGIARGRQRFKCKICGFQTIDMENFWHASDKLSMGLTLWGMGFTKKTVETLMGINRTTLYRWIRDFENDVEPVPLNELKDFLRLKQSEFEFEGDERKIVSGLLIDLSAARKKAAEFFKAELKKAWNARREKEMRHKYQGFMKDEIDDVADQEFMKLIING